MWNFGAWFRRKVDDDQKIAKSAFSQRAIFEAFCAFFWPSFLEALFSRLWSSVSWQTGVEVDTRETLQNKGFRNDFASLYLFEPFWRVEKAWFCGPVLRIIFFRVLLLCTVRCSKFCWNWVSRVKNPWGCRTELLLKRAYFAVCQLRAQIWRAVGARPCHFFGVSFWQSEIWYRKAKFLIFLWWVNEKQGRVRRGYGTNSWLLQCWGNTYSTWRSSWFSNVRNQKSAPLLLDRFRDLAEYTSKTGKGTISVSARVLHAATSSTAWLRKLKRKLKRKTQAKKVRRKTQAKKAGEKRRRTPQRKPAAKISNVVYSAEREWFKISPQVFSSAKCAGYEALREQSGQPGEHIKGHQGCQKQGYSTFGKSRADWNTQSRECSNGIYLEACQILWFQRHSHGHFEPPECKMRAMCWKLQTIRLALATLHCFGHLWRLASSACPKQVCQAKWVIATQIAQKMECFFHRELLQEPPGQHFFLGFGVVPRNVLAAAVRRVFLSFSVFFLLFGPVFANLKWSSSHPPLFLWVFFSFVRILLGIGGNAALHVYFWAVGLQPFLFFWLFWGLFTKARFFPLTKGYLGSFLSVSFRVSLRFPWLLSLLFVTLSLPSLSH